MLKCFSRFAIIGVSRAWPSLIQGENLNDGEWHNLSVVITQTEMKMKLDKGQELRREIKALNDVVSFGKHLYVGHALLAV